MRAREFMESFNAAYPIEWDGQLDAYFANANKDIVHVSFGHFAEGAIWYVSFGIQDNHDLTGKGDEFRTFATVVESIRTFIGNMKPRVLMFSSAKADVSRTPLYRRMVQRLTAGTNYVDISKDPSVLVDNYVRDKVTKMINKFDAVDTFAVASKYELKGTNSLNELALQKNTWELLWSNNDKNEVGDELVSLVKNAYSATPMGSFVNSIRDVLPSDWEVMDWDKDPDIDVLVFHRVARGNETWVGHKIQGLGHDGTRESKMRAIAKMEELLQQPGWWIESSDAMQHVLRKRNLTPVTDINLLRQLFNDPRLEMVDQDTYVRTLPSGTRVRETVFGKPVLK